MSDLPQEFLDRMKDMLKDEYDSFLAEFSKNKYQGLRINTLKSNGDFIKSRFELTPVPWCDTGYYYDEDSRPGKNVLHEAGAYYIQEPSAMSVAENLDVKPGDFVLDLCSAPGGKATQIACKLDGQGLLIANEIVPSRAKILAQNIERMGIKNCMVLSESPQRLANKYVGIFDKIVVDAPCSGEGMFRKNETAIEEWSLENVQNCKTRQLEILDCAVRMLKQGGRIVYSTCTFSMQENEEVIDEFLTEYPDFEVIKPVYEFCHGFEVSQRGNNAQLSKTSRLFPHKIKGEGHFVAVLQNKLPKDDIKYAKFKGKLSANISKIYEQWEKQVLNVHICGNAMFGQNLYSVPEDAPDIDKIKVEKAGLWLGEIKKDRFEPSHSLALALKPQDVKNILKVDEEQAKKYIAGETLDCDIRGWAVVVYKEFVLGWCKCDGTYAKNHYPKGLRKVL